MLAWQNQLICLKLSARLTLKYTQRRQIELNNRNTKQISSQNTDVSLTAASGSEAEDLDEQWIRTPF